MALSPDLLEILRCPEARTPLRLASEDELRRLNDAVTAGTLTAQNGEAVSAPLDGGLVREDGAVAYAIRDDIPVLLVDEGIPLAQLEG